MQVDSAEELNQRERIPTAQADYPNTNFISDVDVKNLNFASQASHSLENIDNVNINDIDKSLLEKTVDTRLADADTKMTKRHNLYTILDDIYQE